MAYRITKALKNKEWPSHKKRIKLIRFLRGYFAKVLKVSLGEIKIDPEVNNKFHSRKVPTRKFLNTFLFNILDEEKGGRVYKLIKLS